MDRCRSTQRPCESQRGKLKVLFTSYGSIAQKHIAIIKNSYSEFSIGVLRGLVKEKAGNLETFYDINDAIDWKPDVVLITSPAIYHIEQALIFASHGCHLYIEKPLSVNLDGITDLEEIARSKDIVLKVGYNLRHLPVIRELKKIISNAKFGKVYSLRTEVGQWLPDWRPGIDYRKSVTAKKELGGGALLELSHEVDYLRFVFGEVCSVMADINTVSDLNINVEDNVEAILKFHAGFTGTLHLDLLRRDKTRKCLIICEKGTIIADLLSSRISTISSCGESIDRKIEPVDSYEKSLEEFFAAVKLGGDSEISLSEGQKSLSVTLAMKRSAELKRMVQV